MKCHCRNCQKVYDSEKARGDYKGFCSAKCQHAKAKELGYRKGQSEYQVLHNAKEIGDVPTEEERVALRKELKELEESPYGSISRKQDIRRLLSTRLS